MIGTLVEESKSLGLWLHEKALPLWLQTGFRSGVGCFAEAISEDGHPTEEPTRARVFPRQIYCFANAGLNGWQGDWATAVFKGIEEFDRSFLTQSGYYGAVSNRNGELVDPSFDLYNQAFAILAFAYVAKSFPTHSEEMSRRARDMLRLLRQRHRHEDGGFHEAIPYRTPLRSNPHMHLFEASLACEISPGFDGEMWRTFSDELAHLCLTRFIDAETGALREFFDLSWAPLAGPKGKIIEPGHQFEWAWLLAKWGQRRDHHKGLAAAHRLFEFGETYGICSRRQVAVMSVLDDFSVADPMARLWPQAEWLKGAISLALLAEDPKERSRYIISALRACDALKAFFSVNKPGLWHDKMNETGILVDEPSPASSLYHIVCAIYELDDGIRRLTLN